VLTLAPRQGEFPGMLKSRTFRITWVREGIGAGPGPSENTDAKIIYNGHAIEVQMPH
jgi:alpha-D-xyloside xylohydrolase